MLRILFLLFVVIFIGCGDDEMEEITDQVDSIQHDVGALKTHTHDVTVSEVDDHVHEVVVGKPNLPKVKKTGLPEEQTGNNQDLVLPPLLPSPPMGKIAFESNGDICVIDPDGTNWSNLTLHRAHDTKPTWSPDGKQIAFVSNRPGGHALFIMQADGANPKHIGRWLDRGRSIDISDHSHIAWMPNSDRAIVESANEVYMMMFNGNAIKLFDGQQPVWSPDGNDVVFVLNINNGEDIYIATFDGDPIRLTFNPRIDSDPAWSPDGRYIAYSSQLDLDPWNFEIMIMNPDGSNIINLTNNPGEDRSPTWSPDSKKIAFSSNRDENFNWEIYVMNVDGTNPRNITNNANTDDHYPDWQPR